MATLLSWLDDPLKKRLEPQNQAKVVNAPLRQNGNFTGSTKGISTPSQPAPVATPANLPRFQSAPAPKAPVKTSNFSLNSLSQKPAAPQLSLQRRNSTPNLSTVNNGSHTLTTLNKTALSPTLGVPTALKQPVSTSQNSADANLALERTNQAKERYNSLRDNNNEFWGKYQSALETTKDQYKDIFGKSTQQRSVNQLGAGLQKMTTEQGSLPTSGEDFVNKYRSLSSDDKWDVWQNLQKAKTTLTQAIGKADDEGQEDLKNAFSVLLSEVSVYDDMIAGEDRGKKSFGKSLSDWATSGGIVGNMAEPATNALGTLSEIMGNKGGAETAKAISQDNASQNYGNNKTFDAINFAGNTVANIAGNMVTGGAYGLANAGLGLADSAASAITDRNRNYYTDADGNVIRENQSTESKLAGVGNSALSAGLTVAGMKGFGPNINFKDGQTLQSLIASKNFGEIGKAMGKYAAKEAPFALATTAASQGISALGGDKNFTDDFGAELANNIVGDLAVDLTGAVRQGVGGNRDLFKPGNENDPSALQVLAKLGTKINDELNERGGIGLTTKLVDDNQNPSIKQKAKSSLDTLRNIMSGNNAQRPAYAGADGDIATNKATNADLNRNFTIIKGGAPDGSNLVKTDYNLPKNYSVKDIGRAISETIRARFQGNQYRIGNTDTDASITKKTRDELSYQQPNMSSADFAKKGSMIGNLNELIENMQEVRRVKNHKADKKPSVDHYISGRVAVDLGDGKTYYPRIDVEVSKNGNAIGYNIADIREFPRSKSQGFPSRATNSQVDDTGTHSRTMNIAQEDNNVNAKSELDTLYKKYGSDFYDKMPDNLRTRYDQLLDAQPRSKDGTYTDPITGEKWIDQAYNDSESTSRLNDLVDGKLSYDDYSKFQSDRLWEAFQDSNGGVETFLTGLDSYNSDGSRADVSRHTVSNNGTLYRQLFDEQGRKPSRKQFNAALEDVLTKGEQSKYYEAFKEFDPDADLYNSGNDDIDTLIATREYVNSPEYRDTTNKTEPAQNVAQPASVETTKPEVAAPVTDQDIAKYVKSQVAAQKAENKTPIKQRVQDTLDNLKHYLVDDAVAYERYVKDKGERTNLREGVDRVRSSDIIAKQMIEDSGLAEAIGTMKTADADEFQQYLIAKRSQELKRTKGADFKTGRNDAADQALIKSVGNKYAEQEKVVREFNKKMLDYSVDTGLISKALRDQLIKDNTDYVPMNRVLDDVADMGMHKSKQLGHLSKQTAVQKIEGSDRIVQNPLESMIRNAIRTVNEGERNKVAKQLSETAAFREARLPEGAKPKPGNDKLSFIVGGQKVDFEVPALVAEEMKNLNGVMPDFAQGVIKVLGAPTQVLRTGATGANPMFAVSNLIRDQLQTTITGSVRANLRGTPKALKATFGVGEEASALRAELSRQGIIGSEYRQTYGYKSGDLVKELQQAHQLPKQAWEKLKHPIDTLADVIGTTEYFTRAQQYYGTKGTVTEKSQAARNNTLNFGRAGATVRVLNKVIPFLNAGVQGGRITVNQFKERPVRTTMAVAAFAGVAAAVRGANSAQNQELWDRIGDEEKQSNLIIFGDDAHYDPETNRVVGVTKIPLPQMVYPITDAVNNLKGKSEDLLMLGGDVFTAITGIDANNPVNQLLPTAAKPFVEWKMNKNIYTGQELVSDHDSNLNPEDKGKKYTTGVARSIARATGIDAPVIDNFIQNWGGGLFKDLTKVMTDNPDNKSDGGGVGEIFSQGAFRRFMSASVESQYDIQATLAEDYKKKLKADPVFQALDANEQKNALDCIDTDTKAIAGYAAKTEQGRSDEITSDLSKRQKTLMQNGFDVSNYNKPARNTGGHNVEISDSLSSEHKDMLDKYNSMEKEDWERYIYSVEGREAEYKLAAAKLENDKANGKLTEVQELKRRKELQKLKVSQTWDKSVRDAYSLAGSKTDMQGLLDELDNRDDMVGYLNALNRAMYDAGVITASTYKSRNRNINNLDSATAKGASSKSKSKTAYSAASKSALSAYTKALAGGNGIKVNGSTRAPSTNRKMSAVALATSIKKASLGAQAKVSVKKGIS